MNKFFHDILRPKQKVIWKVCREVDYRVVEISTGVRFGKSEFAVFGVIDNLIKHGSNSIPNYNTALFAAKTLRLSRDNLIGIATRYLKLLYDVTLESRQDYYTFKNGNFRYKVYIADGNDKSSIDRIQGMTFRIALLDEANLMPRDFIDKVPDRTVTFGSKAKIIRLTNPNGGKNHWYYTNFIMKADYKMIAPSVDGALGVVEGGIETIERRKQELPNEMFRRNYLGEWVGQGNDSAFPNFTPVYDTVKGQVLYRNLWIDFGTVDSISILETIKTSEKLYFTNLYYHSNRETQQTLVISKLVEMIRPDFNKYDKIYCDSAELTAELKHAGANAVNLGGVKDRTKQYLALRLGLVNEKIVFATGGEFDILIQQITNARLGNDNKIVKPNNNTVSEAEQIHALDTAMYAALIRGGNNGVI